MQPLKVRTSSSSPIEARAIELLRSVDRYQPPLGLKQRIRIRLLERATPRRRLVPFPAFAVALILVAAGASAALSGRWLKQRFAGAHNLAAPLQSTAAAKRAADNRVDSLSPSEVPESSSATLSPNQPVAPVKREPRERTDLASRSESSPRTSQSTEKVLVFDAMRALRREGRPDRAVRLLDEYLRRYPEGSLAEEALALSIEAYTALSDPKAKTLADRYLSHYPAGRFASAAERARARFTP